MTDAAIIFRTHFEAIKALPKEQRVDAYEALIEYCLDDELPTDGMALAIVTMAAPVLKKWKAKRDAGRIGGSKRKADESQPVRKEEANDKQNGSKAEANGSKAEANGSKAEPKEKEKENKEKDVSKDTSKKNARFVKPTTEEVKAYCSERGNGIDADRFVDYYESNGWRVGKNPMKDWRACVRSWERNGTTNTQRGKPTTNRFNNFQNSQKYDFAAIEAAALAKSG